MRLIDADVLEDVLLNHSSCYCGESDYSYGVAEGLLYARDDVKEAPTIDAEPVRHGKLLCTDAYPHRLYCSECSKTLIPNEEICFEKNEFPKYCMWCGAKMEGAEV